MLGAVMGGKFGSWGSRVFTNEIESWFVRQMDSIFGRLM
jgi:hypothetical protein